MTNENTLMALNSFMVPSTAGNTMESPLMTSTILKVL